jgi:hypothetical protein
MNELDAQLQQPDTEAAPLHVLAVAPRFAVVGIEGERQAMDTEHLFQCGFDGCTRLAGKCCDTQAITGMIVDDGQRMQGHAVAHPAPALEVHLPELVWFLPLEAPRRPTAAQRRHDPVVTAQNGMDGRRTRDTAVFV